MHAFICCCSLKKLSIFDKCKMLWWFGTLGRRVFLFPSVPSYYLPGTLSGTCLTSLFRLLEDFCWHCRASKESEQGKEWGLCLGRGTEQQECLSWQKWAGLVELSCIPQLYLLHLPVSSYLHLLLALVSWCFLRCSHLVCYCGLLLVWFA